MLYTKRSLNRILLLLTIIIYLSSGINSINAQELKEYNNGDYNSRSKVYEDSEGNLYSKVITVRLKKHIIENALGRKSTGLDEIKPATAQQAQFIAALRGRFGPFKIKKSFPKS